MAREEEADPAVFDACAAFSPRASQLAILSWDDDAPGHSEKELVMDRDQVNCLHYLFQGDPIDKLPPDWWERDREKPPEDRLFWCPKDTTDPLYNRNILQGDEDGYLQLPTPCKDWRKLAYTAGNLDALEAKLMDAFARVSARYPHEGKEPPF